MASGRPKAEGKPMAEILGESRFDPVSTADKAFVLAFDHEMRRLGYGFGGEIGSGFCWGKYMIVYRKRGVADKKVFARIYIRESDIVLRLFFSKVDNHHKFIESAPRHIKDVFTGEAAGCKHCKNERDGACRFRKVYTIAGRTMEKCNGHTFRFEKPEQDKLDDYVDLFTEFYPLKRNKKEKPIVARRDAPV